MPTPPFQASRNSPPPSAPGLDKRNLCPDFTAGVTGNFPLLTFNSAHPSPIISILDNNINVPVTGAFRLRLTVALAEPFTVAGA
ncbi:hypothetical protein D3C87_1843270 [compost metagenome]